MRELKARPLLLAAVLAAVLALAFQGSRGLWEPDEGRNVNIALGMLSASDWLVPRLNGQPYLDKPPLHYWSVAAGLQLLGRNEWGARVPQALLFLGAVALVGALAGRMWGRAEGGLAALVYTTTLTPFAAANVLTPDTPLATFTALLYYAYWRAEEGDGSPERLARWGWWLAAGGAVGLGLLTKGPAILVFLPPLLVHLALRRRLGAVLREPGVWTAAAAALLLGAAWYGPVLATLPGAPAYLFDNQVTGRLVSAHYQRHPGWGGMVAAYLPVLTLGTLPWSPWWCWHAARSRRDPRQPRQAWLADPARLLVLLWVALPLPVFLLASSRLPLYLLPLFAPFALATGRALARVAERGPRRDRPRLRAGVVSMAVWCLLLLGLKGGAAGLGSHRDDRGRAQWLRSQVPAGSPAGTGEIVAVDVQLNGLRLYGYPSLLWVTSSPNPYPLFSPLPTLDQAARGLAADGGRRVVVVPRHKVGWTRERLESAGLSCGEGRPSERLALLLCQPAAVAGEPPGVPAGGGG